MASRRSARGRVFPIEQAMIEEGSPEIPTHWTRIVGIDIGYDHPTAAVWIAWDRDADIVHVYDAYRVREQTPVVHAAAIRLEARGFPLRGRTTRYSTTRAAPASRSRSSTATLAWRCWASGRPLRMARAESRRALMEMLDRMQTGRLEGRARARGLVRGVSPVSPQGRARGEGDRRPHVGHPLPR